MKHCSQPNIRWGKSYVVITKLENQFLMHQTDHIKYFIAENGNTDSLSHCLTINAHPTNSVY